MKVKTRLFLSINLLVIATLVVVGLLFFATTRTANHHKRAGFSHAQLDIIYELQGNVMRYLNEINDAVFYGDDEFTKYDEKIYRSLAALDLVSGREQEFLYGTALDLEDVEIRLPRLLYLTSEIRRLGTEITSLVSQGKLAEAKNSYQYLSEDIYGQQFVDIIEASISDEKEEVALSEQTARRFSENIKKITIVVAIATIVVLVCFVLLLVKSIDSSLQALAHGTKKVTEGIFTSRVELVGNDEFAELGTAFNLMTDELDSRENKLKESNKQLQLKVEERRQAEKSESEARQAAEAANMVKSEFLANMSHEIRTPMNGIIGFTDMLLKMDLGEKQRKFLQLVKVSSDRLLSVINNILDFSRIEAGKLGLDSVNFNLRQSLDETMKMLQLKAMAKKIELDWRVAEDVPDELIADEGRLCQVLINLVANALKFTDDGQVEVQVNLAAIVADTVSLHFLVRDSGPGIPEDKQGLIFESFSQVDNSHARSHGGAGLGLAISAKLVEMMGGKIWVESAGVNNGASDNNPGATFNFTVRCGLMAVIEDNGVIHARNLIDKPIDLDRGLKILLVEDDKINQIYAREILSQQGLHVTAVGNGMMAVEAMKNSDYGLILMDIQMPEMDGYEATWAIRKMERESDIHHTPIIAMTAHAMKGDAEKCLAAGMDDYVPKPIDPDQLFAVIKKQVEKAKKDRESAGVSI